MGFLINHGEKIVAAIFTLIGCLALSSASWAPTDKNPLQLEQEAKSRQASIPNNAWPAEEKEWFKEIPDVLEMTSEENIEIVDVDGFRMAPFHNNLRGQDDKRTAVAVLAPESPIADVIVVPVATVPEEDPDEVLVAGGSGTAGSGTAGSGTAGSGTAEELTEAEKRDEELAKRFGIQKGTAGGPGGLQDPSGYGAEYAAQYGGGHSEEEDLYADAYGDEYGYGSDIYNQYGIGTAVAEKGVRVAAGVSVRMIIDLRKQREILRKALHLKGNYLTAQNEILYLDLIVERRDLDSPGQEWESVSIEDLAEILRESIGIDRDIVSPAVTRNSITMPLPRRATGLYLAEEVSHPRVENFELDDDEKELIDKTNELLRKEIEEIRETRPVDIRPSGFSEFSASSTDLQSLYNVGDSNGIYGDVYQQYDDSVGPDGEKLTEEDRLLLDATKATAEQRLLLLRFMDFTIERGRTYQYRAQVAMKNPNYNVALDILEDPILAVETELFSDWSEPTPAIHVPEAHRTYLTDVAARGGEQEKATLTVFTDTTETGLFLLGNIRVKAGMPITGVTSLDVVDLRKNTLDLQEVTLETNEVLAAAEELPRSLLASDHPELKNMLARQQDRSVKPIPDQVCIVDSSGGLVLRSTGDNAGQLQRDRQDYEGVLNLYEDWRESATAGFFPGEGEGESGEGSSDLGLSPGSSSGYGGFYSGQSRGESRRTSSRERARQRRREGSQGSDSRGGEGSGSRGSQGSGGR